MTEIRIREYDLEVRVYPSEGLLRGKAIIRFENPIATSLFFLLNKGLKVKEVRIGEEPAAFKQNMVRFRDIEGLEVNLVRLESKSFSQHGARYVVSIIYEGRIEPYTDVFLYVKDRISKEFSIIRLDAYSYPILGVPEFSKLIRMILSQSFKYELEVYVDEPYVVANIGRLVERKNLDGGVVFKYVSKAPSWRIDIAIAHYEIRYDRDKDIRVFAFREDVGHAERLLHETKRCLEFYREKFGPPPRWCGYTIIEIPSTWGSQADVCGMLLMRDSFVDKGAVGGLYHELAHLWNVRTREEVPSRFLDEAFASYFQILAEESLQGAVLEDKLEKAKNILIDMHKKNRSIADIPPCQYGKHGLTDAMYFVGVWILHKLRQAIGDKCFEELIREFISRYGDEGATLEDFARTAKSVCGRKVGNILDDWLFSAKGIKELLGQIDS